METKTLDPQPIDLHARVKLAANASTPSDVLAYLARDKDIPVRAALALNPSAPVAADLRLANDADERVRMLLARKVATALPGLSDHEGAELRERTLAVLGAVVRDECVRIRAAIANAAAELANLPHNVVMALAKDDEVSVSEPMLRLSPLLSAEDLLGLLAAPPHSATANAIACRANLSEVVSDAIAASADSAAIRALLANPSAMIRETTIDALVARSTTEPAWHAPLVQRPSLPDHAARALSEIVTAQLLKDLAARTDLSAETISAIQSRLNLQPAKMASSHHRANEQALLDAARRLEMNGALNEDAVLSALRAGDMRWSTALLAVGAGVSPEAVDRAASLRSAKALVSLVWKAGFSMRVAGPVQTLLGQIKPDGLMNGFDYNYPLSTDEMNWQLDFLGCNSR